MSKQITDLIEVETQGTGTGSRNGRRLRVVKRLAKVELADGEAAAIIALRLAVLRNGYAPIPTRDKRTLRTGWNALDPNEDEIRTWLNPRAGVTLHPATGLLVVNRLVPIDGDLPDVGIVREVRLAIRKIAPQLFKAPQPALERGRDDGSPKFMLFARRAADAAPFTIKSKKWSEAPEDESAPTFQVEIFASDRNRDDLAARQVGSFGPHTVDDETGEVRIRYQWRGPSPADVPLADLPVVTEDQALAIVAEADRILSAHGMQPLKGYRGGKFEPTNVYDLDETTLFDGADFAGVGLKELTEFYWQDRAMGIDTRCSGSFTGEGGTRQDRCHVGWSGDRTTGHITVHDYATETTHRPTIERPTTPEGLDKLLTEAAELFGDTDPGVAAPDGGEDDTPSIAPADPSMPFGDRLSAAIGVAAKGALTETAIARALVGLYGDWLCYVPTEKRWLRFEAPRWIEETAFRVETMIVGTFCQSFPLPRTAAGAALRKRLESQRHYSAVERLLRGLLEYRDGFDLDPYLAAGPKSVVDLKTGEARPGRPEDRLRLSWKFDPSPNEDCPTWMRFIAETTLRNADLATFLKQWMGLSLCGDPTHQKIAYFHGEGRNGKNTFIDTMKKIVGGYGYKANVEVFMDSKFERHSTDKWALRGKRMVVASEIKKGSAWDENAIKSLTGDDEITARGMRKNNIEIPRTWTITVIGNNEPDLKDVDEAIKARLLSVPFDNYVPADKRDLDLQKKLLAEAPGILRWAINGLLDVRDNGLVKSVKVQEKTEGYFASQDIRQGFVDDCIAMDQAPEPYHSWLAKEGKPVVPEGEIDNIRLFRSWKSYAEMRNGRVGGLNGLSWIADLTGAEKVKTNVGVVWRGIALHKRTGGWSVFDTDE